MRTYRKTPLLVFFISASLASAEASANVKPEMRLMVAPFENRAGQPPQDHFSLGLAATLSEKLEDIAADPALAEKMSANTLVLEVDGDSLVLSEEQFRLLGADRRVDRSAANALALKRGATHFLTGFFSGKVEDWSLTVEVYEAGPAGPVLAGSGAARGSIFSRVVSMKAVHGLLAAAASEALAEAGIVLPEEAVTVLRTPQTADSYAYILLNRAYGRLIAPEDPKKHRTPLEFAEHAVRVDPEYAEARRLYAELLWRSGKPGKARTHYEEALKRDPRDIRSLSSLGRLMVVENDAAAGAALLEQAAILRPGRAETHFWLGRAYQRLESYDRAIAEFERARGLDGADLETRRELSRLYARSRRYADAAEELEVIVAVEPENLNAVFELAACLRAAGRVDQAGAVYAAAVPRFPKEPRLEKFRRYLERSEGDDAVLGGFALIAAVNEGAGERERLETFRGEFQEAANDAVLDVVLNGKKACQDGEAAASYVLAMERRDEHERRSAEFLLLAERLRTSLKKGEGAFLTSDEMETAAAVTAYAKTAASDRREMRAARVRTLEPLLKRNGCPAEDGTARPAKIAAVRERNGRRYVELPAPKASNAGGMSPVIPTGAVRIVQLTIVNDSADEYALTFLGFDGKPLPDPAAIPAGRSLIVSVTSGIHRFCLLPKRSALECGAPSTVRRQSFEEDGWKLRVR